MSAHGWRIKLGSLAVVLVAIAAAVIALGSGGSSSADAASGRARAGAQASDLLDRLALPAGAQDISTQTQASRSPGTAVTAGLDTLGQASTPQTTRRVRRWTVGATLQSVRATLLAHPPRGTRARQISPDSLSFRERRPPSGLSAAAVKVTLLAVGPRSTAVIADAVATWVRSRPAAERVPASAGTLMITRGVPGRRPGIEVQISDRTRVARIAALINRLPIVQPGVFHCPPAVAGLAVVRFTFRAASGGPVLAQAGEDADVVVPSTACDPLRFSVGGRAQIGLLGGAELLREVSRWLHVRLWSPPYAA